MQSKLVAGLTATLLLAGLVRAEGFTVSGKVMDERGQPVPGIELGTHWEINADDAFTTEGVETDEQGAFVLELGRFRPPVFVLALDLEGKRAGLLTIDSEEALEQQHEVVLAPTVQVTASFSSPAKEGQATWVSAVFIVGGRARLVSTNTTTAAISLPLPPGAYKLWLHGRDVRDLARDVTVPAGTEAHDVGSIELQPTIIAEHVGKAPPAWNVTEARGVEPDVTLADYSGKWVLLEFWGYW